MLCARNITFDHANLNAMSTFSEVIYEGDETWPGCDYTLAAPPPPLPPPQSQQSAAPISPTRPINAQTNGAATATIGKRRTPPPLPSKPPQMFTSTPTQSGERLTSIGTDELLLQLLQSASIDTPRPPTSDANTSDHISTRFSRLQTHILVSSSSQPFYSADDAPAFVSVRLDNTQGASDAELSQTMVVSEPTIAAAQPPADRQTIKYELLEETDAPPHSPPRIASPAGARFDIFGQTSFTEPSLAYVSADSLPSDNHNKPPATVDPFEVRWTSAILQNVKMGASAPIPSRTSPHNPFITESAPVNV